MVWESKVAKCSSRYYTAKNKLEVYSLRQQSTLRCVEWCRNFVNNTTWLKAPLPFRLLNTICFNLLGALFSEWVQTWNHRLGLVLLFFNRVSPTCNVILSWILCYFNLLLKYVCSWRLKLFHQICKVTDNVRILSKSINASCEKLLIVINSRWNQTVWFIRYPKHGYS